MAAMTTVLTEFSQNGNSRTCSLTGHTASQPKLLIEKRRVPEGSITMAEYSFKVVEATLDADGNVLSNKISFESVVRYPILGQASDIAAALAIFVDVVSGDEFANSITTQEWLT